MEMINAVALMGLPEVAKGAMELLKEAMNLVSYLYGPDVCDLKELHKAGFGEELVESVDYVLCDPPYNATCQSELEHISHDMLGRNAVEHFCALVKKLIKPGGHSHVFCSALQFALRWGRI